MKGAEIIQSINTHISTEIKDIRDDMREDNKKLHERIDNVYKKIDEQKEEITKTRIQLAKKADLTCVVDVKKDVTTNRTNIKWIIRILVAKINRLNIFVFVYFIL